ncbi:glycosyltransferase [Cytobacillus sp. Hm23]
MVVHNIEVERGGMTSVMLNRSRALAEKGYNVSLVTLDDNNRYQSISEELRKIGRLSDKVGILNVYDYYKDLNTRSGVSDEQLRYYGEASDIYEKGYDIQSDELQAKFYARYFKDGVYVKYKKWNKDFTLSHIDYFDNQRNRTSREIFNKKGYIEKIIFFNVNTNKQHQVIFKTEDGFTYLNKWFNPEKGNLQQQFLFTRDTNRVSLFKNNIELHSRWLNEICEKEESKPFVICDGIGSADKILSMDKALAYRIYPLHTNHFQEPYTFGSEIKEKHRKILTNLIDLDSLVVLSEDHKIDITNQFGNFGNVDVIPNSITKKNHDIVKDDSQEIAIVARYDKIKQIDHAIKAFAKVVNEFPNAKLNIYGNGADEERLIKLITHMNLHANVFIKGYSKDVSSVYNKSLVTLLTSKSEAFGLVIAESMLNQTPVISYDINYGPRDIITNNIDGFLVPKDNIEKLADKIIFSLKNQDEIKEMGLKAKRNIELKFTNEIISKKWINLFETLKSKDLIEL